MVYMYECIAMGYIAFTLSVAGFGPLSVSVCAENYYYTFYVIEIKPDTFVAR